MSFGKAKIRRFNDVHSDTPAPGAYNPVIQYKIKGHGIQKSKRFPDDKIVSKPGPSNGKAKNIPKKDPTPVLIRSNANKGKKNQQGSRTQIVPERVIRNQIHLVESEIENLKDKISAIVPGLNNKVEELRDTWQKKKLSLIVCDEDSGKPIDDNSNNILKATLHDEPVSKEELYLPS